jgi:hypothetical protein
MIERVQSPVGIEHLDNDGQRWLGRISEAMDGLVERHCLDTEKVTRIRNVGAFATDTITDYIENPDMPSQLGFEVQTRDASLLTFNRPYANLAVRSLVSAQRQLISAGEDPDDMTRLAEGFKIKVLSLTANDNEQLRAVADHEGKVRAYDLFRSFRTRIVRFKYASFNADYAGFIERGNTNEDIAAAPTLMNLFRPGETVTEFALSRGGHRIVRGPAAMNRHLGSLHIALLRNLLPPGGPNPQNTP